MKECTVSRAKQKDIKEIAALFTEGFKDSVLFHCGCLPKEQAAQDLFTLVYEAEPMAALVARTLNGKVVGYCFSPIDISRLWVRAITGFHIVKWTCHWLTGQYGFGFYPVKMLLGNKFAFFRSAFTPGQVVRARILSIAVASDFRGQGIGSALLEEAMEYFQESHVKRARLEVRPDNSAAIKIYQQHGFVPAGMTRDAQGEWSIMIKEMES